MRRTVIFQLAALLLSTQVHALSLGVCTGTDVEIRLCKLEQNVFLDKQAYQTKLNALDARLCITQFRAAHPNYRELACQPKWIAGIAPAGIAPTKNICLPGGVLGKQVIVNGTTYTCSSGQWVQSIGLAAP